MIKYLLSKSNTNKFRYAVVECNEEWNDEKKGYIIQRSYGQVQGKNTLSPEIIAQTQWGFFITERDWCDLLLYNPDIEDNSLAYIVKRLSPIPEIQEKFKKLLDL